MRDPPHALRLEWDETTELLAFVRRDAEDGDVAEVVKVADNRLRLHRAKVVAAALA